MDRNNFIAYLGLLISLFGIVITIGNDYYSQYNFDIINAINTDLLSLNKSYCFVKEQKNASTGVSPKYFFILDVSGSIKKANNVDLSITINNQINELRSSGFLPNSGFDFGVNKSKNINSKIKIGYHNLLQVRLLHILKQLHDNQGDKLDYSIVLFSDNPEIIPTTNIYDTFQLIVNEKFNGKNSNFILLLKCLQENILKDIGPADSFKKKECNLIFFSDYLHDDNSIYFRQDLENCFLSFLKEMKEKNVNIKLHYYEVYDNQNNNNKKKTTSVKTYSIHELFSSIFPWSKIEALNIEDGSLNSPLVLKRPIPFHYINDIFEEELTTYIDFKNLPKKKSYLFGLQYSPDENEKIKYYQFVKQEYYLINGKDTIHLSETLKKLEIKPTDKVLLKIKGYIPAPYNSPDIVIQDNEEGIRYIIPVAFYKKSTNILIGTLLVFLMFLAYCIYLLIKFISFIIKNTIKGLRKVLNYARNVYKKISNWMSSGSS